MSSLEFSSSARRYLEGLRESPQAPIYNFQSSDLLDRAGLQNVLSFEASLQTGTFWKPGELPHWMPEHLDRVRATVPYYSQDGGVSELLEEIPSVDRRVLQQEPWNLVPSDLDLDDLTVYTTSGTTATSLSIPTHPVVSSMLLVLMNRLLAEHGVSLRKGPGQVSVALICCQQETLTYPSLSHYLEGGAFLKLNLLESCWQDPAHRSTFLGSCSPGVLTGDPYSFKKLLEVAPQLRPDAMISSAVALHPGFKAELEEGFECPVFDVYSLTESRFIAASDGGDRHKLLSPDLYVEILGPDDEVLEPGEVGEITLTGGRNVYLPLVRYRTGDRGALEFERGQPYLTRFQGREEVRFADATGRDFPSLDIVHVLRDLPLVGFSCHQSDVRELTFEYCGEVQVKEVEARLEELFGFKVECQSRQVWDGKPQVFSSELGS